MYGTFSCKFWLGWIILNARVGDYHLMIIMMMIMVVLEVGRIKYTVF